MFVTFHKRKLRQILSLAPDLHNKLQVIRLPKFTAPDLTYPLTPPNRLINLQRIESHPLLQKIQNRLKQHPPLILLHLPQTLRLPLPLNSHLHFIPSYPLPTNTFLRLHNLQTKQSVFNLSSSNTTSRLLQKSKQKREIKQTYHRLRILIHKPTAHKNRNIMLSSLHIGIVDRRKEAYISYFEARLFKNLSSCTVFKTLVEFEVAARMAPCSLRQIRAMSQVVGIIGANQWGER